MTQIPIVTHEHLDDNTNDLVVVNPHTEVIRQEEKPNCPEGWRHIADVWPIGGPILCIFQLQDGSLRIQRDGGDWNDPAEIIRYSRLPLSIEV